MAGREVVDVLGTKVVVVVVVVVGVGEEEEEGRILPLGGELTDTKETDGAASRRRERRDRSTLPPSGRGEEEEGVGAIALCLLGGS